VKQFEPGNQSGDITLPDSVLNCILLDFPESITAALYSTALLIKKRGLEDAKREEAKAAAAASCSSLKETLKRRPKKSAAERKLQQIKKAAEDALNKRKLQTSKNACRSYEGY
jgi:predicted DNA-binding transcriptional regulator YafY